MSKQRSSSTFFCSKALDIDELLETDGTFLRLSFVHFHHWGFITVFEKKGKLWKIINFTFVAFSFHPKTVIKYSYVTLERIKMFYVCNLSWNDSKLWKFYDFCLTLNLIFRFESYLLTLVNWTFKSNPHSEQLWPLSFLYIFDEAFNWKVFGFNRTTTERLFIGFYQNFPLFMYSCKWLWRTFVFVVIVSIPFVLFNGRRKNYQWHEGK